MLSEKLNLPDFQKRVLEIYKSTLPTDVSAAQKEYMMSVASISAIVSGITARLILKDYLDSAVAPESQQ